MGKRIDWAKHDEAQGDSGLTTREYCAVHKLSVTAFYSYRSNQRKKAKKTAFIPLVATRKPSHESHEYQLQLSFDKEGSIKISGTLPHLRIFKDLLGGLV